MKKKTKSLEAFLIQAEHAIDLHEDTQQVELNELINKWKIIALSLHSDLGKKTIKRFRNLHHLKLRIQWMEKTASYKKKTNKNLTMFFNHLNEYIDVEIKCIRLKRMKLTTGLPVINLTKKTKVKWTETGQTHTFLLRTLSRYFWS